MTALTLSLKREYFEAIRDGSKKEEFRLVNDYWKKRLVGRKYDRIVLTLGYPSVSDTEKRIEREWKGFSERWIFHKHFGLLPVRVFAIDVSV